MKQPKSKPLPPKPKSPLVSPTAGINVEVVLGVRFGATIPLLRGILRYAREHPRWCVRGRSSYESKLSFRGRETEPDGILAVCPPEAVNEAEFFRKLGKPIVTFYADVPHDILPTVAMDERAIGRVGAEHLITQGFRRFAFCGVDTPFSLLREEGFCAAVCEAGYETPKILTGSGIAGRPTWHETARANIVRWVAKLTPPIGVMAMHDDLAGEVVEAALARGLRVPEDLAVLGVDDNEVICESAILPLSSVHTDLASVGYAAAEMLDSLLAGNSPPPAAPMIPPRGVTVRASSDVLAFEDPDLLAAVRFIRAHACEGITASKISTALAISPRSLQRIFQRTLGCRPGDEIRRVKVSHARELLIESDHSLQEISRQSGYATLSQLCAAFKSTFGQTLQEFRHTHRPALVRGPHGRRKPAR